MSYLDGTSEAIDEVNRKVALVRYAERWAELVTKWSYAQAGPAYPQLTDNDRDSLRALMRLLDNTL